MAYKYDWRSIGYILALPDSIFYAKHTSRDLGVIVYVDSYIYMFSHT